jgi:hypothetical protein
MVSVRKLAERKLAVRDRRLSFSIQTEGKQGNSRNVSCGSDLFAIWVVIFPFEAAGKRRLLDLI